MGAALQVPRQRRARLLLPVARGRGALLPFWSGAPGLARPGDRLRRALRAGQPVQPADTQRAVCGTREGLRRAHGFFGGHPRRRNVHYRDPRDGGCARLPGAHGHRLECLRRNAQARPAAPAVHGVADDAEDSADRRDVACLLHLVRHLQGGVGDEGQNCIPVAGAFVAPDVRDLQRVVPARHRAPHHTRRAAAVHGRVRLHQRSVHVGGVRNAEVCLLPGASDGEVRQDATEHAHGPSAQRHALFDVPVPSGGGRPGLCRHHAVQ
mmetsp:Transcript_41198/g.113644  ORF Transcript_41198/g.113644 Transcript_41198/m.113644 type:complete len:266 (-) Transcript_41198:771-1568(-)